MDCQIALNILDSVLPSEDPNGNPDFQEAFLHVDTCRDCTEIWFARKHFDQQVAKSIVNVSIPNGLKESLLEKMAELSNEGSDSPDLKSVITPSSDTGKSSYRLKQLLTALSLCFIFGIGYFFWSGIQPGNNALTLITIQSEVPGSLSKLEDFNGSFEPALPEKGWKDQAFTYSSVPKGISSLNGKKHDRAIFGFELSLQNQKPVQGVLVVYSKSSVKNQPDKNAFDSSSVVYLTRGDSKFASVSWVSGDQVFVCYVYAGSTNNKNGDNLNGLEAIERVVNLPTV